MADYTPVQNPGHEFTFTASAPVTGGQVVIVTGPMTVGPATAASPAVVGVAGFNAAAGARVTVFVNGMVHETVASGAITAGAPVASAATGKVAAAAGSPLVGVVGLALTTAADGALVRWIA
jgi:hypothetical protein